MAFTVPKVPIIIASVCLLLALIFQLVGVASSAWLVSCKSSTETGIFRTCVKESGCSKCASGNADVMPGWWKAVQAFAIMGMLALIGAMVLAVLHFFKEDVGRFSLITAILSGIAAFCILIEFAVFAGETGDLRKAGELDLGHGFILTIIACIASGAAAVLFFVGNHLLRAISS